MAANTLESTVKAEWGEAKGFYWTPLLEDIGNLLTEKKKERFLFASLKGLIAYGVGEEEDLQNISDDDEKFARKLSAKGVPDAICDLLFEKYVATKKRSASDESDDSNKYSLRELFNNQALQTLGNDGISFAGHHLNRRDLVQSVIEAANLKQFVVVGSPPATGKTSLMQLISVAVEESGDNVCLFAIRPGDEGVQWLFDTLKTKSGIDLHDQAHTTKKLCDLERVWVLIDDAQGAYAETYWSFWETLIKDLRASIGSTAEKIRCVIAATYDLSTPKSPVAFASLMHVPPRGTRISITDDEAEELFVARSQNRDWETWINFKATLMEISNGHIGVFMQGLRLLEGMRLEAPRNKFSEEDALHQLRGSRFFDCLTRCFPSPGKIPKEQLDYILDAIVHGEYMPTSSDAMEVEDSWEEATKLVLLCRSGVLTPRGQFTCMAAEWFYYNRIFPYRSISAPPNIDVLVIESVRSMSATRLQAACGGGFPKEAAFQQLFNEAMSRQLPRHNTIIPELNTKAIINGKEVTGEVDFYINGELQWALELLRQGSMITKHILRFQGKYRHVAPKAFLVVDCRGPKTRSVQRMEERCTLYFSEDFKSCICAMRGEPEVLLQLQE